MLQATDRPAARTAAVVQNGSAAEEVQGAWVRPTYRATPIKAARADIVEQSIAVVAVARQSPFERSGKCPSAVITTPTQALVVEFRFGG